MSGLSAQKTGALQDSARRRPKGSAAPALLVLLLLLLLLLSTLLPAAPPAASAHGAEPDVAPARGYLAVVGAFDSLLEAGNLPAAKALCTGQVLRMFDFLAMAQGRMAGLVDSARSTEDTLWDSSAGDWAFVKMASRVVFRQPFLGQNELASVQAVHLHRSGGAWRIAEFEELEGRDAPVRLRSGLPQDPDARGPAAVPSPEGTGPETGFLPISPKAPREGATADWVRLKVKLRDGSALAALCPLDAYQTRRRVVSASEWILETRVPGLAARPGRQGPTAGPSSLPDSLRAYLAEGPYLILDSALRAAARAAVGADSAASPVHKAAAIRAFVTGAFRFKLGSVLFGDSRSVLRDMTGDCSEAAILVAALLRASGVPSRVALGFASPGRGVFIGHAWTEAWLGPRLGWVGVDAALGQFPAGAERVKLAQLDGRGDMRIAATNLMLAAVSNLDIEILAARKGGRRLPLIAHPGAAREGAAFFEDILEGLGRKE